MIEIATVSGVIEAVGESSGELDGEAETVADVFGEEEGEGVEKAGDELLGLGVTVPASVGAWLGAIPEATQKIRPASPMNICENTLPSVSSAHCASERVASPEMNSGVVSCRNNSRYCLEQVPVLSKSSLRVPVEL